MAEQQFDATRRRVLASAAALTVSGLAWNPTAPAHASAPMLGVSKPRHYRFKLGACEVTTLLDSGAMLDGPWPIVGENQPEAAMHRLMRENLLPESRFQPGFTPALVNTGRELILFDTGNGERGFVPRPAGGWLARILGSAGFTPEQIDIVVLTHGHPDHIGGLMEDGKPLCPNARYIMGDVEYNFWSATDARLAAPKESNENRSARLFAANVAPLADKMTFVKPGGEVAPGIHAFNAYGHTPGHLAFHIESEGERLLFWGDCAHHEVASLAQPGWHVFFDMDKEQGAATRKRIYDIAATERLAVVGYHTSFPSVGFVARTGSAYRWIPLTYQFRV